MELLKFGFTEYLLEMPANMQKRIIKTFQLKMKT